jgi:hypothetical protein
VRWTTSPTRSDDEEDERTSAVSPISCALKDLVFFWFSFGKKKPHQAVFPVEKAAAKMTEAANRGRVQRLNVYEDEGHAVKKKYDDPTKPPTPMKAGLPGG